MYHVELLFHFDKKGVGGGGQGVVGFIFDLDVGAAMMWLGGGGGGKRLTIIVMLDISKASLNPHKCSFS